MEQLLRTTTPPSLPPSLAASRAQHLDELHAYAAAGVFPTLPHPPTDGSERAPCFIDDHATPCAVGHLMQASGAAGLADAVNRTARFGYLLDEFASLSASVPGFATWVSSSGFSPTELATIQPTYDFMRRIPQPHSPRDIVPSLPAFPMPMPVPMPGPPPPPSTATDRTCTFCMQAIGAGSPWYVCSEGGTCATLIWCEACEDRTGASHPHILIKHRPPPAATPTPAPTPGPPCTLCTQRLDVWYTCSECTNFTLCNNCEDAMGATHPHVLIKHRQGTVNVPPPVPHPMPIPQPIPRPPPPSTRQDWNCSACSYANDAASDLCAVCLTARDSATPPVCFIKARYCGDCRSAMENAHADTALDTTGSTSPCESCSAPLSRNPLGRFDALCPDCSRNESQCALCRDVIPAQTPIARDHIPFYERPDPADDNILYYSEECE